MRAAPPTSPADTPASGIHQDQDQLPSLKNPPVANARVAEAGAPSHHYNRSKPRKLLAIQQGGVIGIASESGVFLGLGSYRWILETGICDI
jgi:hypothetical protein